MQWVAKLHGFSLDWQEMPADYLNLTTQRADTLAELRDLVNRHLVARGFTMLVKNDVISVFRIADLEPSLVPRVTEDQLFDLPAYDFVKITFDAPRSMDLTRGTDELRRILSPYSRISPLVQTRRVVVMDVAANLLAVSELFNEEREIGGVPREFVLKYARADKVIETLYVILGINPDQQPQQMEMQFDRRRIQALTEYALEGGDVQSLVMGGEQQQPKVYLVHNARRNSVLANAPAEQMRVIEAAVKFLDVPQGGEEGFGTAGAASAAQFGDEKLEKVPTRDDGSRQDARHAQGNRRSQPLGRAPGRRDQQDALRSRTRPRTRPSSRG